MPNYQPITRSAFNSLRWMQHPDFRFAAQDVVAPLVTQECSRACLQLIIAFAQDGDFYLPVALQGFKTGQNLLVGQDGSWLAGYIPAVYRGAPFALLNSQDGQQVLCVDEDSGLIGTQGEVFFDEDGEPGQSLRHVLDFLSQLSSNREITRAQCASLQKFALIQPWPIKLKTEAGEQTVQGLYRIDEGALNQLPAEALIQLRDNDALLLAYCQLLSMQHLTTLGQLLESHTRAEKQMTEPITAHGELDLSFLSGGDTLSFRGLG